MDAVQSIPLAKLKASAALNVRKTGGKKVDDLVASIAAHGLRQNLTVIEAGKGFEVVAGGRRLRALQQLAKAGALPAQLANGVPCMVVAADAAAEISLAENTIREAMHPLDQFAAFQAMADTGKPLADIAAAFGVSELVVKQRLRLGRVSPKLLKAYGDGGMTMEQLQALAVSDNHALQEGAWKRAGSNGEWAKRPEELRRELSRTEIGTEDPRVQLVGLAAYEAAGGRLRRDLFSPAVFVEDVPLLDSLVEPALQEFAERVRAEGWGWVEVGGERPNYLTRRVDGTDWPDETTEEYEALEGRVDLTPAESARRDQLEDSYFTPEQLAAAGARVVLGHGGPAVYRGLLRDGDASPDDEDEDPDDHGHAGDGRDDDGPIGVTRNVSAPPAAEKDPAAIPQRLVYDITLRRTGELRVAMSREPQKAVTVLAAHLAEQWRREHPSAPDGILISMPSRAPDAGAEFGAVAEVWKKRLAFKGPILDWLIAQPFDATIELLAFVTAESVDIVKRYPNQAQLGDALCAYLDVELADHWRPDAEFLLQMPAAAIHAALADHVTEAAMARAKKMKKAELAGYAAEILGTTRWVPACVQLPAVGKSKAPKPSGKAAAAGDT